MLLIEDLRARFGGRPALIIGGGEHAPAEWDSVLGLGPVTFGINHHAARYRPTDLTVFCDRPAWPFVADLPGLKLSIERDLSDVDCGRIKFSGLSATWATQIAIAIGCAPVLLAGMDCWSGARAYWHDYDPAGLPSAAHRPVEDGVRWWRRLARYADLSDVRALGGPLVEVFGQWRVLPGPQPHAVAASPRVA